MNKFFYLSLAITASFWVNIPSHAIAPPTQSKNIKPSVRIIPYTEATGTQAQLQTVEVWPGHGVSISFYQTGEIIQRVWLDDPSHILVDVDGCLVGLSNRSNCQEPGAGLIHLRQINPVQIPGLPSAKNGAHLTVITQSPNGDRQIYNFRVLASKGKPRYSTIQITPDITRKEIPPTDSIVIATITRGLEVASERRWITSSNPLWQKLQHLLQELESGKNLTIAAQNAQVSYQLVERLLQLGSTKTTPTPKITPAVQKNPQSVNNFTINTPRKLSDKKSP